MRSALDLPILLANPTLLEQVDAWAQAKLASLYTPATWAERVANQLGRLLRQGEKPTLDAVARALAVSRRNLQKKLKLEGLTYRTVLDTLRQEIALELIQRPDTDLCELAFFLGFSEQSAFNHAFKRWTGNSPGQYQAKAS